MVVFKNQMTYVYSKHRNGNKTFFFSCLMIISNTGGRIMHRGSNETDMIKIFKERKESEVFIFFST